MFVFASGNRQDYRYIALRHFLDKETVVLVVLLGDSGCASDLNQQTESIARLFEQIYEFNDSLFCRDSAVTAFVQADGVNYLNPAIIGLERGVEMRFRCDTSCAVVGWPFPSGQCIAETRLAGASCTKNENANVPHWFICLT